MENEGEKRKEEKAQIKLTLDNNYTHIHTRALKVNDHSKAV